MAQKLHRVEMRLFPAMGRDLVPARLPGPACLYPTSTIATLDIWQGSAISHGDAAKVFRVFLLSAVG